MEATKYNKSEIMRQAHRYYVILGDSAKNSPKMLANTDEIKRSAARL